MLLLEFICTHTNTQQLKSISWNRHEIKSQITKHGPKYGVTQSSNYKLKSILLQNEPDKFRIVSSCSEIENKVFVLMRNNQTKNEFAELFAVNTRSNDIVSKMNVNMGNMCCDPITCAYENQIITESKQCQETQKYEV